MLTDYLYRKPDSASDDFDVESMVNRIRDGETGLRNTLIEHAMPFIRNRVSRMVGTRMVDDTDELSVGILAFNESIDAYKSYEPGNFLGFAATVIQRRIIDHQRRMNRQSQAVVFSDMSSPDGIPFEESQHVSVPESASDTLEFNEEIKKVESRLERFGLRLEDMHRLTPRHTDTRVLCVSVAQTILEDATLLLTLYTQYRLPVKDIVVRTGLHRKTIEKHRRFVIFLVLLLDSGLEKVKAYIRTYYGSAREGGSDHE